MFQMFILVKDSLLVLHLEIDYEGVVEVLEVEIMAYNFTFLTSRGRRRDGAQGAPTGPLNEL